MANVPHSGLTGADLHESKGTAAAAVSTIFVADGAGSGSFVKVPLAALSAGANSFGGQLLHVREEQSAGSGSATASVISAWTTSVLQTVKTNEIAGASLSSNQITLPAGTYFLDAHIARDITVNSGRVFCRARLFNFTTSAALVYGPTSVMYAPTDVEGVQVINPVKGRFTLAGSNVLQFQYFANAGTSGDSFPAGPEIYSDVLIWKVA